MNNDLGSAEARMSKLLPEQSEVLMKYKRDIILNGLSSVTIGNKFAELNMLLSLLKKHI
jgi:hypothetical protein